MIRRSPLPVALAACLLAGGIPATAADPTPLPAEMPRATCKTRFIDKLNDAQLVAGVSPNTPGADTTGVFLRMTPTQFQVFLAMQDVKKDTEMGTDPSYKWDVTMKFGDKPIGFKVFEVNPSAPTGLKPTPGATAAGGWAGGAEGTSGTALAGFTADVYPDANYVIFTAPRSALEANLGGDKLKDTDKFTDIVVTTSMMINTRLQTLDNFDVALAQAQWTVGDDGCFGAPPGVLSNLVTPNVQFTDGAKFSAKLVDENGAVAPGKPVQFSVAGDPTVVTGTTDATGVATATWTAKTLKAGKYDVTAFYPGDAVVGKAKLTGSVNISAEPTLFGALSVAKPSSTSRVVTATLLDNDKHVVAGQRVDWYVNGRKVATVVTDSKGRSVFKGAKPTQTVLAKYAGLAGKYGASASKAVKV